ncbi:MAG: MerR family transcriptional regulator [Actinomycetota bacterium]|nr:MerR family transcriptional regulator [Actinomycetota bacterium]
MSEKLTIDEVARAAGTTSRNVRAHQSRGLLPPPKIKGRVGYYDEDHVTRLKLIAHLQQRGFGLSAINDLLHAWEKGSGLAEVLGFSEALTAPWSDEVPEVVSRERLEEMYPEIREDPALLQRAVELELLTPEGDGYKTHSPRLLRVGAELVSVGIPLAEVLDQAAALRRDMWNIAVRLVSMFTKHVWEPFVEGKRPDQDLSDITEILQRTRPLAAEAVQAFLALAMQRATEEATSNMPETWSPREERD